MELISILMYLKNGIVLFIFDVKLNSQYYSTTYFQIHMKGILFSGFWDYCFPQLLIIYETIPHFLTTINTISKLHTNLCKLQTSRSKPNILVKTYYLQSKSNVGLRWCTNLPNTQITPLPRKHQWGQNTVTKTSFWKTGILLLVNFCYSIQHKYRGADTLYMIHYTFTTLL